MQSIEIEHLGANSHVTGSCHFIQHNGIKMLVDCGLTQGTVRQSNIQKWPVHPSEIDYLFVTHAHIGHIGRIPELIRKGFKGEILTTHATKELMVPMLEDFQIIENMHQKNPKKAFSHMNELTWGFEYNELFQLKNNISFKLGKAGHILGSCFLQIQTPNDTIVFSGDLGQSDSPILCKPDTPDICSFLCLESTYGHTVHDCRDDRVRQLGKILSHALSNQGKVIIPAFALGRTCEILYEINRLFTEPDLKEQFPEIEENEKMPIFLDTPSGKKNIRIFSKMVKYWNKETNQSVKGNKHPVNFSNMYAVENYHQHLKLADMQGPSIIIAGNSMCTGGRILNHLQAGLPDWRNDIVFTSWQELGTLGNEITRFGKRTGGYVFIDNKRVDIKANIHELSGYSAHADQVELIQWVNAIEQKPELIQLVHGQTDSQQALKIKLNDYGYQVETCVQRH